MCSGKVTKEEAELYSVLTKADEDAVPEIAKDVVTQQEHRKREAVSGRAQMYLAAVARKVPRSEWDKPKARAALDAEWEKLRTTPWPNKKGIGTWDESTVEESDCKGTGEGQQ